MYPPDVFNEALDPFIAAVPPCEAGPLALKAAEAVSAYISSAPSAFLAAVQARPDAPSLMRWEHWEHHLEQIERALSPHGAG